jgi:cytochrome c peroxidase
MTNWKAAVAALALAAASTARGGEPAGGDCKLFSREASTASTADCARCHENHEAHPVDVDYAAAAARQPFGLRRASEAVRRGVFLPDGRVACVTCHDAASPWKHHIALPPGAAARPAVNPRDASTYTGGRARPAGTPLQPGAAVTPTPLCLLCHAFD